MVAAVQPPGQKVNLKALLIPLVIFSAFGLPGCWNGENVSLRMGDVSIGQQLIDLKRALEEEAIDEAEYQELRTSIMSLAEICGNTEKLQGERDG